MSEAIKLVNIPDSEVDRYETGIRGFDKFLGGGFVPGSTMLFAGEPGVGKSTFLLQVSNGLAENNHSILYASGEENLSQIKSRANRLGTLNPNIWCSENLNIEELFDVVKRVKPTVVVIDSIQLLYSDLLKQQVGSPAQIRSCVLTLIEYAKKTNMVMIFIGHSTKQGKVAGLLTLQHMVDAVFFMSNEDEDLRKLTSNKNRYGATMEWLISMTADGIKDAEKYEIKKLPYKVLSEITKNSAVNRLLLNSDIRWAFEKSFGKEDLHKIQEYDIIYKLENDIEI